MSHKIGDIRKGPSMNSIIKRDKNLEFEFKWVAKQVEDLGASQLTGKRKRDWEAKKIKERGGLPPKQPKIPINILKGMRAKQKEREQKKLQKDIERGIHIPKKKRREEKEEESGIPVPLGNFKDGILKLKQSDIKAINSKKKR